MDKFTDPNEKWVLLGANMERVGGMAKNYQIEVLPTLVIFHKGVKVIEFKGMHEDSHEDSHVEAMMKKVHELSEKS